MVKRRQGKAKARRQCTCTASTDNAALASLSINQSLNIRQPEIMVEISDCRLMMSSRIAA